MNLIQEQITAIQKKTDLAVSYQELADDELKAVYEAQKKAIKQLNEKYCAAIDTHGDDFALAMNEFKQAYEKIVKECMDAVEAKRDEYIAEIRKSLDLEAKNQHLAQLAKMPELLAIISNIQSSVKVQPEVSSKITTVSHQIDGVKSTLDSMEKKIGTTRSTSQNRPEGTKEPTKKRRWPFSMFSRKK
jgi:excinuclease UvrABC nuclease subunit